MWGYIHILAFLVAAFHDFMVKMRRKITERPLRGRRVAGGELRHLAGSPGGGGGIRSCHTLSRVHTV